MMDLLTPPAAVPAGRSRLPDPNDVEMVRAAERRIANMETERSRHMGYWREIKRYVAPHRGIFTPQPNAGPGELLDDSDLLDPRSRDCLQKAAAGMRTGTANQATKWFRMIEEAKRHRAQAKSQREAANAKLIRTSLGLTDDDDSRGSPADVALDEITHRFQLVLAQSNFYKELYNFYEELIAFGTAIMLLYFDRDSIMHCQTLTCGEYFLALDERGEIATVGRKFVRTAEQVAARFPIANCSQTVRSALDSRMPDREVIVAHLITPNPDFRPGAPGLKGMPWREVYWEWGQSGAGALEKKGYHEKPFMAVRWHSVGNHAYGIGQGHFALPDVRELQGATLDLRLVSEKLHAPSWVGPDALRNAMSNQPDALGPNGLLFLPAQVQRDQFSPAFLVEPAALTALRETIDDLRKRIDAWFYLDLFLAISRLEGDKTATEIQMRKAEQIQLIGEVFDNINAGFKVMFDRLYGLMNRAGMLPQMPPDLGSHMIGIEYFSALALAQAATDTVPIEQFTAFVGNLGAVHPDAYDKVNFDATIDSYGAAVGVPARLVISTAVAQAARQQRMKAEQQQQALQNTMAAVQGAQTLSKTDVGGGQNALQRMIGGGQ